MLRFKSDCHDVYTEKISKIALSSNDEFKELKEVKEFKHLIKSLRILLERVFLKYMKIK